MMATNIGTTSISMNQVSVVGNRQINFILFLSTDRFIISPVIVFFVVVNKFNCIFSE